MCNKNNDKTIIKATIVIGLESQYNLVGDLRRFTITVNISEIYDKNLSRPVLLKRVIEDNLQIIANIHTLNLLDADSNEAFSFRYDKINYIHLSEITFNKANSTEESDKVNIYPIGGPVF